MIKKWIVKKSDDAKKKVLTGELSISPVIAQLLINRHITQPHQAERFMNPRISDLYNPFMLKGMEKAVARIHKALSGGEKILIYGDYDVDGITSVTLLTRALKTLGGNVIEYIPNRLEEGYGLNLGAAQLAYRKKVGLIITVDCGISALKEIKYLNNLKIDTIIVDHHQPDGNVLPKAYAIINPLQEDCSYPFKYLAGVGLTFKLVQALLDKKPDELRDYMALVALGTVSDIVPQLDENRILTKYGLDALLKTKNIGIKELIRISGLTGKGINAGHIGYTLGPRINASGRIGSPKLALRLLTTEKPEEAALLAKTLDRENRNRQKIEKNVLEEALDKAAREVNFKDHRVIVLSGKGWHPGVIGIVASRLAEKFYRPTIMVSINQNIGKGSARSIKGFHLFDAISKCKKYLDSFGGHKAACGLTILPKFIDKFRTHINNFAAETLMPEDLIPSLEMDMELPLHRLSGKLIAQIGKLGPYGPGNPRPLFVSKNVTVKQSPKAIGRRGIKTWVTDGKVTCEALIFRSGDMSGITRESIVNLAYTPSINEWAGLRSIQLNLEDIKSAVL